MISMPIMHLAFKIDVFKMEHAFQTKYRKGDNVFHISPLNWKGEEEFIDSYVDFWNAHCHSRNEKLQHLLLGDPNLKFLSRRMFYV